MPDCVIYARVSTKEQHDEGYSIPAQLKAIRAFCEREGLYPVAEFVEAESAGKAGRTQFTRMLAYLAEHPDVEIVVAHKLDRLYRNFADQVQLEELLAVRARYVVGDVPDSPQGELLRDVQLSVAKFYLGNLAEEVKKGMEEKASQGGWPHKAPLGYLNVPATRTVVVDPDHAPLVTRAFERFATGIVSVNALANESYELGLRSKKGERVRGSALDRMLRNPFYTGVVVYGGEVFPGAHDAIVPVSVFERVQEALKPRKKARMTRHTFLLRDFLFCDECGCKITAETQKGHAYYHCTNKRFNCSQRRYIREEELVEQVEAILARIALSPEIVDALVQEARELDADLDGETCRERDRLGRAIAETRRKESVLTDKLADGVLDDEMYREKVAQLKAERSGFELQVQALSNRASRTSPLVEQLASMASGAYVSFGRGDMDSKRELLAMVISNLLVRDGRIVSYQWKRPFEVLEMDPQGAFLSDWWAV